MKKTLAVILTLMMILSMMALAACGGKTDGEEGGADPQEDSNPVETAQVVKTIDDIDGEDTPDIPLQIESITLFDDGSVRIVPTDDLLKNAETNNELVDGAAYPFADSGKVKDIYLVRYGNGGYRTLICLMDDGTLSALSANELIGDHIFIVMDRLTGRDNYTGIRQDEYDDAFGVTGLTDEDEEIELDFSLDF